MKLEFRIWLESTVSQAIKNQPNYQTIIPIVQQSIKRLAWAQHFTDAQIAPLVKLFTHWVLQAETTLKTAATPEYIEMMVIRHFTHDYSDYLVHLLRDQPNVARSKFNNPQYNIASLKKDSDDWHEQLKLQKRRNAAPGRKVNIAGMPPGYTWVSLDEEYCDREGDAMGHCGNAAHKDGDNIWSLRDNKNTPYLTFIVNNKILGEAKGFGNNKPEAKYHPHIVALLLGHDESDSIIEFVKGGGYKPENNFMLKDLEPSLKQQVLTQKPQLNDYFLYLKTLAGGNENKWKEMIDDAFNYKFLRLDVPDQRMILKQWDDMNDMIAWLKDNTESKLDEIPDFDNTHEWEFNVGQRESVELFEDNADAKNKALMQKIMDHMKKQEEADEDEDQDIEWAVEQNDDLAQALEWSAQDGYRSGAESDAYDSVLKFFKKESDHQGFTTDAVYGGGYFLYITLKDLENVYKSTDDWESGYNDLNSQIKFSYSAPYNGYSGFDEHSYNERLHDMLSDVLSGIKK